MIRVCFSHVQVFVLVQRTACSSVDLVGLAHELHDEFAVLLMRVGVFVATATVLVRPLDVHVRRRRAVLCSSV